MNLIQRFLENFISFGDSHGTLRYNSIVSVDPKSPLYEYEKSRDVKSPFFLEGRYLYIGEIVNMPGHGIFIGMKTRANYVGYHISDFQEIPEEEV